MFLVLKWWNLILLKPNLVVFTEGIKIVCWIELCWFPQVMQNQCRYCMHYSVHLTFTGRLLCVVRRGLFTGLFLRQAEWCSLSEKLKHNYEIIRIYNWTSNVIFLIQQGSNGGITTKETITADLVYDRVNREAITSEPGICPSAESIWRIFINGNLCHVLDLSCKCGRISVITRNSTNFAG